MNRDGDHSSRPIVADWLKRPTRRSLSRRVGTWGGQPLTPPYLVLHCEEFAWPRVLPRVPVRSYIKSRRTAPFHPSPFEISNLKSQISEKLSETRAGLFSVALVVNLRICLRSQI